MDNWKVAGMLIQHGADVTAKRHDGRFDVERGKTGVADMLIDRCADVTAASRVTLADYRHPPIPTTGFQVLTNDSAVSGLSIRQLPVPSSSLTPFKVASIVPSRYDSEVHCISKVCLVLAAVVGLACKDRVKARGDAASKAANMSLLIRLTP